MTAVPSPFAPEVRVYAAATAGAAVVMALVLAQRGDPSLAFLPLVFAALGLCLRWTWAPGVAVFLVGYLLVYPYGLPFARLPRFPAGPGGVRFADVILAAAVVAYVTAQFRLFSLTLRAVPDDRAAYAKKTGTPPPVRPADTQTDDELFRGAILVLFAAVLGVLLWLAATNLAVNLEGGFPLKAASGRRSDRINRGAVLLLALGGPALLLRFVFWVRRWKTLSRDEAGLAVLDAAWVEDRRELARQETWRAWGRGDRPRGRVPWKFSLALIAGLLFLGCAYAVLMVVIDSLGGL